MAARGAGTTAGDTRPDSGSAEASAGYVVAFRKGLGETGYIEGQNVTVEPGVVMTATRRRRRRSGSSRSQLWPQAQQAWCLPALMEDLVRR